MVFVKSGQDIVLATKKPNQTRDDLSVLFDLSNKRLYVIGACSIDLVFNFRDPFFGQGDRWEE